MEYMITRQGDDPERLENDRGEITAIYVPVLGSGWATYGRLTGKELLFERMLFDPYLALAIIKEDYSKIREIISNKFRDFSWLCSPSDMKVRWIEKGLRFTISNREGLETITTEDEIDFITA